MADFEHNTFHVVLLENDISDDPRSILIKMNSALWK